MTSDFPKAVARLSEGFCPLCDADLRSEDIVGFCGKQPIKPLRWCDDCGISWAIDTSVPGAGPQLIPSRKLKPKEITQLYARTRGGNA